jgi:DNA-damage-inducible protein J
LANIFAHQNISPKEKVSTPSSSCIQEKEVVSYIIIKKVIQSRNAINLFAKAVLRQRKIPFEIASDLDPFNSEVNQARLIEAAQRMKKTGGTIHELIEVEDD